MSSEAIASKCLARDVGLPRSERNYLNSQFCKQKVDIARSVVTTSGLHDDSGLDEIRRRKHSFGCGGESARNPLCLRFLVQDRDQRGRIDNH
jgi:hypothetical protein